MALLAWSALPGSWPRTAASAAVNRECFLSPDGADEPGSTVALGDSLTEGTTFPALNLASPVSYFDVLGCRDAVPYVANEGAGGETSTQIAARVDDALDHNPDRVVVLAGTNDLLFAPDTDTIANLEKIRAAIDEAGVKPVFGLLPPLDSRPDEVTALNDEIAAWASEQGVTLIDFWTPVAADDGTWRDGLNQDEAHPTPDGAQLLADAAAQVLN